MGVAAKAGITKARRVREQTGLGLDGPVPDLLALAERDLGVPVVIPDRLPGDLAGAYLPRGGRGAVGGPSPGHGGEAGGAFPVILLNGADAAARLRFTLAHELAHHVFGDHRQADTHAGLVSPGHWIEVRANAFAAELLMPAPAVADYEPTPAAVTALAARFGTSLLASAIRLETAGVATPDEARALKEALDHTALPAAYEDSIAAARRALPRWPNPNSPLARGLPQHLAGGVTL